MVRIINKTSKEILFDSVIEARSRFRRLVGLIGTKEFQDQAMYFPRCNSIHTFFMSMAIDVIYLDKKGLVRKVDHNIKPWRFPLPVFSAHSVIEVAAGTAKEKNIQKGDILHVGN